MMIQNLEGKQIILASQSQRRKELLTDMGLHFEIQALHMDESYPSELKKGKITEFIAEKKSYEFGKVSENQILITADTIVWHKGKCLEKPKNREDAFAMLAWLSASKHTVYSSVSVRTSKDFTLKTDKAKVYFESLTKEEIENYIIQYQPFDKAGSYGIQDWMGICKISKIKGSYFTIMGLPTHLLYDILANIKI